MTTGAIERQLDRNNILVLSSQLICWAACLAYGSRLIASPWVVPLIVFFCLMMQGVFSMMHECFHGHAHRDKRINEIMCTISSTIFGASATLIRLNHLGHHVRNRTRAELVDFVEEDESRVKKTIAYYLAIFGGIWLAGFVGSVLLAMLPARVASGLVRNSKRNTYAAAFADFEPRDFSRIRLEVAVGAAFWIAAYQLLDLNLAALLVFYGAFALSWSSLQWIYHVRTPLHVVEGTYNVRAPWLIRALFLNFNYNLTHHRDPSLRWQRMHRASNLRETRPFFRTWLAILRPPVPIPEDRVVDKSYF